MRVLGIDPGTTRIGYGIVEGNNDLALIDYGVIEIASRDRHEQIVELESRFSRILDTAQPDRAGIETLYFSKNQKTALAVSESRGILMLTLLKRGIPVTEHRPGDVKTMLTNYALADKEAVRSMVKRILRIPTLEGHDDASDALAIAITASRVFHYQKRISG
jgi:crossover junction endodeoxyribonuclease RuvC